ncbi:hypothetical protein PRIPAC_90551 [Pristionchus pacificus]|uniref:Uncharacterized protein n=1 Tax=Pristionchus pacificus TaxID=54126 RepID=A0A2A6CX66_PRIPA|nr:hypothetical protein PRIPAC_90551 [Pristionchus pacificus]|eukprot:PDM82812.1 hypothetical protein PRIPAC_37205 [Pristionchus pacificus]
MSYNPVAADVENGAKAVDPKHSVFIHRQTCQHCGKFNEREIAPEHLHHHVIGFPPHHPPQPAWHATHVQTIHYTMNVLLVAIVIFLTFFAAKFLYGK